MFVVVTLFLGSLAVAWLVVFDTCVRADRASIPETIVFEIGDDISPYKKTFGELLLDKDKLAWYNRLSESARREVEFYYSVYGYDDTNYWLNSKVERFSDGSYSTESIPVFTTNLPGISTVLTSEEIEKLEEQLDDKLQRAFYEEWDRGAIIYAPKIEPLDRSVYAANLVDEKVRRFKDALAKAPDELPKLEELLHDDGLELYNALHPQIQESFMWTVMEEYVRGRVEPAMFPSLGSLESKNKLNELIVQYEMFLQICSDHNKECWRVTFKTGEQQVCANTGDCDLYNGK